MKKEFRSFENARKFTHTLKIKNQREWTKYCKSGNKPEDIPSTPQKHYKNKGWVNNGDWLGTGMIRHRDRKYLEFSKARDYVQKLELKNNKEWREFTKSGKLPKNISTVPDRTYKNKGWKGLGDWLGTDTVATNLKEFRSFDSARKFVRELKLQSKTEWEIYRQSGNMPKDIPSNPNATYKNKGWVNSGDWLGTGRVATWQREYWTFEKARDYVCNLKLKSQKEWRKFTKSGKLPKEIPSEPLKVYKNKGWKGIGDWLGTGRLSEQERSKNFLSFPDARKQIHELAKKHNIRTNNDWDAAVKKGLIPDDIPKTPWYVYSKKRIKK
jgi:hypothetical protein